MSLVYSFESKIIKYGGGRYVLYPPQGIPREAKTVSWEESQSHSNHRARVMLSTPSSRRNKTTFTH